MGTMIARDTSTCTTPAGAALFSPRPGFVDSQQSVSRQARKDEVEG
jgi:hypothetical protein